jgi:conjugative relaxase-like TrwC/TraI family protein
VKLQITTSNSAEEAEKYLSQKLEAYYSKDGQEFAGDWHGEGAELLGLHGQFTNEAFSRLLNNRHPFTDEQLTDRMRVDRRPGFDMTWGVPKSISITYAKTRDDRIIQAVRQAVQETMELAESKAAVRVRAGEKNRDEDRITGNLVWSEHVHLTARPQDGYSDPHVHVHVYVPNLSWDPVEKKWKALQMGRIHELADEFQKLATKRLSELVKDLGFEIEPTEYAFEIKGFRRDIIEKFSRRTMTIEATAERLGITDPEQKARLGAMTREKKVKDVLMSDFEPFWWANPLLGEQELYNDLQTILNRSRALDLGLDLKNSVSNPGNVLPEQVGLRSSLGKKDAIWTTKRLGMAERKGTRSMNRATRPCAGFKAPVRPSDHDREAIALATEHLLSRNSAVTEIQLVAEASTNWRLDKTTTAGLFAASAEAPLRRVRVNDRVYVTTQRILDEERRIYESCYNGRFRFDAINEFWTIQDEALNAEQRAAALHVLNSRDFITGIEGRPGVGKTRVLKELKRGVEAGMYKFIMLAPWGTTAHDVLRPEGFPNAETVERLLRNPTVQQEARGGVWVVDEAGALSTRDADRLIALAQKLEARLIFVGDSAQHYPVGRGQAFELLKTHGEMQTAKLLSIQRQKGDYLRVVELFHEKKIKEAITLLKKIGGVCEMKMEESRIVLARDYIEAMEKGETTAIVAPTHAEGRAVTAVLRQALKEKGHLKEDYQRKITKKALHTEADKGDPKKYRPGLVVQIDAPLKGYRMNEQFEVVGVREDMVRLRSLNPYETKTRPLPLESPSSFSVYESEIERGYRREIFRNLAWTDPQKSDPEHFKIGLVVSINDHLSGFAIGEQLEVIRVSEDTVKLRNEQGQLKILPIAMPEAFSVHERDELEICAGDKIRITANGRTVAGQRLSTGSIRKVDYITHDGLITFENGWQLKPDFKMIDHGWVPTSHAILGKTVDRIFIAQSPELSAGASDARQFWVSLTRGRKGVKLYTTDLKWLLEYISNERKRFMATELFTAKVVEEEKQRGTSEFLGLSRQNTKAQKVMALEMERNVPEMEYELEL